MAHFPSLRYPLCLRGNDSYKNRLTVDVIWILTINQRLGVKGATLKYSVVFSGKRKDREKS